jgi:hypothetical protein
MRLGFAAIRKLQAFGLRRIPNYFACKRRTCYDIVK